MNLRWILYIALLAISATSPAAAQLPNQPALQAFPQLPPSRPCTANVLPGVWKLLHVYEAPAGAEMTEFLTNPVQYMFFDANSVYGKYIAGRTNLPPNTIRDEITKHASGLQQYLVDASGFVFFYQDKTAIDTQACFMVVNPLGQFWAGQMLLMPPEGQIKGRLVKVYIRVNEHPLQPAPPRGQRR